jgi:hypothetical protein
LFSFWKQNSPNFWQVLSQNPLAFFEDAGEISLSRLSSLVASSPKQYDVVTTAEAFRFQKVGKLVGACTVTEEQVRSLHFLSSQPERFFWILAKRMVFNVRDHRINNCW